MGSVTKEQGIICTAEEVRGLLDGSRTQIRRVIKPQPVVTKRGCPSWGTLGGKRIRNGPRSAFGGSMVTMTELIGEYCPYGVPGDRLWVRAKRQPSPGGGSWYEADYPSFGRIPDGYDSAWKPPSRMPREASRITLELTDVRANLDDEWAWALTVKVVK